MNMKIFVIKLKQNWKIGNLVKKGYYMLYIKGVVVLLILMKIL